jgi:hypothetical protein
VTDFLDSLTDAATPTHGSDVAKVNLPSLAGAAETVAPFDASNDLEDLTRLSLAKARALLEVKLDVADLEVDGKRFDRALQVAKLQLGVVDRILTTQTRVDETRLRRRQVDVLPRLLAIIEEEKRALAEAEKRTIDAKATPSTRDNSANFQVGAAGIIRATSRK